MSVATRGLATLARGLADPVAIGALQRVTAPLATSALLTSSRGGWRFGFSSSAAAARAAADDDKAAASASAGASAAGSQQPAAGAGASTAAGEQQQQQGAEGQQGEAQQGGGAGAGLATDDLLQSFQECQDALESERKRAEDLKDKLLRTLADMENLRERTARTTAETKQFAVQGLVKNLLDVADNLERAAGSVPPEEVGEGSDIGRDRALSLLRSLRDGVLMTDTVLMKVLAKEGVTRYDPQGDAFDPNLHNALFEVPDATKDPGTVAVVVKRGYMLNDRVIRAAEVGVTRAVDQE